MGDRALVDRRYKVFFACKAIDNTGGTVFVIVLLTSSQGIEPTSMIMTSSVPSFPVKKLMHPGRRACPMRIALAESANSGGGCFPARRNV